jgi:2-methylisocitrate lyase-like PEP mutase family enzyme
MQVCVRKPPASVAVAGQDGRVTESNLNLKARLLRSYHDPAAPVLVLPNAWDAASGAVMAGAGARAIATTSGGVAWSLGRPDGEVLSRVDMIEAVRRIAAVVDVPVTADIEAGYGPAPADVAATVQDVLAAGAVGINLEDSLTPGGPLFDVDAQRERIRAARKAAGAGGVPDLFINARTDVCLYQVGPPGRWGDEVRSRATAYAAAGADCLFVPGLLDVAELASLVADSPLPVSVLAAPGGPSVAQLSSTGVRRVSVGTGIAQAAYTVAQLAATELLGSGTYGVLTEAIDYPTLNRMFAR